ncbi:MAG: GNAT family N-acetyltransferase [Nanoarchaeota archaeon]
MGVLSDITLRITQPEDYQQIYFLLQIEDMLPHQFSRERFSRMLERNTGHYLVAMQGGRVVGSIFSAHDGGYYGYVYKLVVRSRYRREGIGSALLARSLEALRAAEIPWIHAHVKKDNVPSLALLKKFGLEQRVSHTLVDSYDE